VPSLDGLRGLAVVAVVAFHAGHLQGGYLGVDLFFTVSGFLITRLILDDLARDRFRFGEFWLRRARRLLPALWALLAVVILVSPWLVAPSSGINLRRSVVATAIYIANWWQLHGPGSYWQALGTASPLNHTWSLAIEEQFYIVWPLVILGVLAWSKRRTADKVLVVSLGLAAASTVLMIATFNPNNVSRAYFGTDTRAAAILLGAALAAWTVGHGPARRRGTRVALEVAGVVGVGVLALAWTRLDGESATLYRGGFVLCGLAAVAVIAAAVHPEPGPISKALSFLPLRGLGLISYGVYLYHWPIDVAFDEKRMGFGGWPLFAFQTVLTLAIALLSYRIIEQPIRNGAGTTRQWRTLIPAVAAGLVLVVAVSTAGARPLRQINPVRHPLRAATQAFETAPPNAQRVLIVGDSVAYFLARAARGISTSPPVALFNGGIEDCAFPGGITRVRYHDAMGAKLDQKKFSCDSDWMAGVIERFRPTIIFWIVSNPGDSVLYHGRWLDTCSAEYAAMYKQALRDEVVQLGARRAKVVLTTAVYPRYVFADEDRQTDCENDLRRAVAADTGVRLLDLNAYICPNAHCREEENGTVLRVDGEHYDGEGGRLVFKWLYNQALGGRQ
jgi:peptidoglycan/LPS O-acetylase OafA/YrhL